MSKGNELYTSYLSEESAAASVLRHFRCVWTLWDLINCSFPALLSMGSSRQEYWSGLPFPSPGDLPNLGIKPGSPTLQAVSLPSEPPWKPENSNPISESHCTIVKSRRICWPRFKFCLCLVWDSGHYLTLLSKFIHIKDENIYFTR